MTLTCNFLPLEISWKTLFRVIHGDIHKSLLCEGEQLPESRQLRCSVQRCTEWAELCLALLQPEQMSFRRAQK